MTSRPGSRSACNIRCTAQDAVSPIKVCVSTLVALPVLPFQYMQEVDIPDRQHLKAETSLAYTMHTCTATEAEELDLVVKVVDGGKGQTFNL